MSDLPDPMVAPEVNLRDFTYMPLDVVRLRDSDIAAVVSAEAFRAAVLLWCAAWHQLPAASLPSDDVSLARLAGFGRDVASWSAVKEEALRGFVLCRDRRLFHPVIAEKANTAWAAKQAQKAKTEAATAARLAKLEGRRREEARDVARDVAPDVDRDERRDEARDVHQGNGREGNVSKRSSSLRSEDTRAGASRSGLTGKAPRQHDYPPDAFERWWTEYPHKVGRGAAEKAFAKVRASDTVALTALIEAVRRYKRTKPADREWCNPATWLNQQRWTDEPASPDAMPSNSDGQPKVEFGGGIRWPAATVRATIARWRQDPSTWPEGTLGPPPGVTGCRVPADLLREAA